MASSKIFSKTVDIIKKNDKLNQNQIIRQCAKFYYKLHNLNAKLLHNPNHLPKTVIGAGCEIHKGAYISERGVIIGNNCKIGNSTVILGNSTIGDNVTIGAGSVIGSEGFQYRRFHNEIIPIIHTGGVLIRNDVYIGPQCCIDKSTFGELTKVESECFIGAQVHIAHDVCIKKKALVMPCSMIAGFTIIGSSTYIGSNSSISDGIKIGDNVIISRGSVETKDVSSNMKTSGNFAIDNSKFKSFHNKIINF